MTATRCAVCAITPRSWVIIITAEGRGFCAGVDIKELAGDRSLIVGVNKGNYETFGAIHRNPKPVIVALHSFVLGGGIGMAGAADIIICSDCARFGVPEIDRGAMGGGAHLRDGAGRAFDIVGPHCLDRIDNGQLRALRLQCGQDVAQVRFCRQLHWRIRKTQALGAHPHLGAGLFAADIDRLQPGIGELGRRLQQQQRHQQEEDRRLSAEPNPCHRLQRRRHRLLQLKH